MAEDSDRKACIDLLRFTAIHERHRKALERATGENFNLFRVLRIGHLEVKTHSPILAELLNPNGSHGQGALFLELFLQQLNIADFNAGNCRVHLEYYAGPVEDNTGGRLDLVIRDESNPSKIVVIENKIFAADQDKQLERYRNKFPEALLFYLTLDKSDPINITKDEKDKLKFQSIGYNDEIINWLTSCKKEAVSLPSIRETIAQYIHLIRDLTHTNTATAMSQEMIEKILEKDNLEAFFALRDMEWQVKQKIIENLDGDLTELATELAEHGVTRGTPFKNLDQKYSSFFFNLPRLDGFNLQITFQFENRNYQSFFFGFSWKHLDGTTDAKDQVFEFFRERFICEAQTEWWPARTYFEEPYLNWNAEAFKGVQSGEFKKVLGEKLTAMFKIAEKLGNP